MKKSLYILLFAGTTFLPALSQSEFGIKTGVSAVLTPIYDLSFGPVGIEPGHHWGYGIHAGVFFRICNDALFFQPELFFEHNAFEFSVISSYGTTMVQQSINTLNLPLLLGVEFDMAHIYFGASAELKIGLPKSLTDDENFKNLYDRISLEYELGFGFDISERIELELRYIGYLGKNKEGIEKIGNQTFKLNKSFAAIMVSIGYIF